MYDPENVKKSTYKQTKPHYTILGKIMERIINMKHGHKKISI